MRGVILFRSVGAYIAGIAIVGMIAALVSTIFITRENLPWTAFLTGILVASVIAEAARASRSEWILMRRTAQLSASKEKLELECVLRKGAEAKLADYQFRLRLMDENLSTMIALVDAEGCCRYHNRAFRDWLRLRSELIDGRPLRELFGSKAYAGIAVAAQQSLDGQPQRYESLQEMPGGVVYRLSVEHVPQIDAAGRVTGFYWLANDITRRDDLQSSAKSDSARRDGAVRSPDKEGQAHQEMFLDTFSEQIGRPDAGKQFIAAIQEGQFCLYCQLISPLPANSGKTGHYEILIRLMEEEGSTMPPGAFFPLAEKNGLMPYLDRWVVQHVLEWVAAQKKSSLGEDTIFFVNVASATIGDPEFPDFLSNMLIEQGVSGAILCFEVSDTDLAARNSSVTEFIRQVRACGCRVALSGFGRNGVSFDLIRGFQVDFLKIDGGTILNMLSNQLELAKVVSIDRVAKKIGVKTVAELVENDEILAKLCEIGIDFAQGFGVSRPRLLIDKPTHSN